MQSEFYAYIIYLKSITYKRIVAEFYYYCLQQFTDMTVSPIVGFTYLRTRDIDHEQR